jgi:hypothetical protein
MTKDEQEELINRFLDDAYTKGFGLQGKSWWQRGTSRWSRDEQTERELVRRFVEDAP